MSQAELLSPSPVAPSFPPLSYQGVPVLTTEMLAQAYEVEAKRIRQNFANNRERFVKGKHFFIITSNELKDFRLQVENFDSQISPKVRALTLWTERGAARNAKMLDSDRAWDVFELLEETFFHVAKPEPVKTPDKLAEAPITPDQQCTLKAMVKVLVEKGGIYAAIWSRFNNHFRLGSYKQLPQSRMSEAVDYLMRFEVASKALPAPSVAAVPNPPASIPADMAPGRKDALRKIQSIMNAIMAAREVVNMFCYPEPATMDRPKEVRLTYNARHDFHAAALDCLKAAYAALEAGYLLERGKSRMQGGGR